MNNASDTEKKSDNTKLVTLVNVLRLSCQILFSRPYCKEIYRAHMTRFKRGYLKLILYQI